MVELSASRVSREVILLEPDEFDELVTVVVEAEIALARCPQCHGRWRLLPCDVLPRKAYTLTVIEHAMAKYATGSQSLRKVAWSQLGSRSPSHSSVHGWSEGLGAHALGRAGGEAGGAPASRFVVEAHAHEPTVAVETAAEVAVDPRRYRSEARGERLAALAQMLDFTCALSRQPHPLALATCRRLALQWSRSSVLLFPSRLSCTAIEHRDRCAGSRSRPSSRRSRDRCQIPTRSPPGASSRSHL